MSLDRAGLGILSALSVLGFAAPAHADARMYTGSLVIHAFGNDTSTGTTPPFSKATWIGIPLTGRCNTRPYHSKETLTFPTYPNMDQTLMFTIPKYGGQVLDVDTNGDGVPDIVAGCGAATVDAGDPLTRSGSILTTGDVAASRTPQDPRGFTLPQATLNKVKSGASLASYGVYRWEVHYADLRNATGVFAKNGGDGSFSVERTEKFLTRKAVQTAGKNRFGGVMRLLGSYSVNFSYAYNPARIGVYQGDWLVDYLGAGGQGTIDGEVTGGTSLAGRSMATRPYQAERARPRSLTKSSSGPLGPWG